MKLEHRRYTYPMIGEVVRDGMTIATIRWTEDGRIGFFAHGEMLAFAIASPDTVEEANVVMSNLAEAGMQALARMQN
jgi:hypothetical protein